MKLQGKVAIVTGSSKGIGAGVAKVFSEEGARVVVVARHEAEGKAMADMLGREKGMAIYIHTDVSDPKSVESMIAETIKAFGRIDILVNNAGFHNSKGIEAITDEEFDYILKTNLYSTYYCSKYALPYLKETKGCIIHMSSMVGLVGQGNACAYAATKGGQIAMAKNMALDLAKYGVRVNVICPGWIETPLVDHWFAVQPDEKAAREYIYSAHPVGRIGTSEECGKAALFLACPEDSGFITGITLNLDGGITLGY